MEGLQGWQCYSQDLNGEEPEPAIGRCGGQPLQAEVTANENTLRWEPAGHVGATPKKSTWWKHK